jgi:CheY-specific phosphatase CheX
MASDSPESKSTEMVMNFLREISKSQFMLLTHDPGIQLISIPEGKEVMGHWMTIILVAGESVRVTFKTHFNISSISQIVKNVFGETSDKSLLLMGQDFMREFSNVVAGATKNMFAENSLDVGVSLPLLTRGFDEVYHQINSVFASQEAKWTLKGTSFDIACSAYVEIMNPIDLTWLNSDPVSHGEVQFL